MKYYWNETFFNVRNAQLLRLKKRVFESKNELYQSIVLLYMSILFGIIIFASSFFVELF